MRPSTYDIKSLNYKEGYKLYFKFHKNLEKKEFYSNKKSVFKNIVKLNKMFKKEFNISFNQFVNFATNSIYYREYSKMIFSKGINDIFETMILLGKEIKINREDLSFIDFQKILSFYSNLEVSKLKKTLINEIKKNKYENSMMNLIKMPDLILDEKDIYHYYESISKPNYITLEKIVGEIVEINKKNLKNFSNKIVKIKNADPGYDYIFNHNIKGLITQYGGANSHMAIRCLELNIPAIIGIGKTNFEKIKSKSKLFIDCGKKEFKFIEWRKLL